MAFEIGQLTSKPVTPPPPPTPGRPAARPAAVTEARPATVDLCDVIPASPPPEVLEEVDAAWERGAQLAADRRELHFSHDAKSGRTIIEVRTLDGEVLRTIPPSRALDIMGGGKL
jgi:hypothetical protein